MKRTFMIVLAVLAIAVACFAADAASAQTKSSKPAAAKTEPAPVQNVPLTSDEVKDVTILKQEFDNLQLKQALIQQQLNQLAGKIAQDHKVPGYQLDLNTFTLVAPKKLPVQDATPSSSK